ncbi:hypothetical protein [Pseudomonas asplenii]|uniref:hypothetical protein n=1 Tax=Pseudomonas asplenii TaxID=53407 RepID=UPI00038028A4|nr:hypothetical protein [Pseudomonas fuscovaginae]
MNDNYILAGDERQAKLEAAKAAFFASGGRATELPTYRTAPLPARSSRIDPDTVLARKRRRPSPAERHVLRKMADSL